MKLVDTIRFWAQATPHRAAIIQIDRITTFRGLADAIDAIEQRIDRLNLKKTEPVAVCLASPTFQLATVLSLLRNGYSVVPARIRNSSRLASVNVRNIISDTEGQDFSHLRNIRFDMSWLPSPERPPAEQPYRKRQLENPSLIFFTSGTTGMPKKVVIATTALDQLLNSPWTRASGSHEKILVLPTLVGTIGFNRTCEVLNFGKTVCFAQDNLNALALINLFGIDAIVASPVQALRLAEAKLASPSYRIDSLKVIFVGGGKIASRALDTVRLALCRNIINTYGSTEAGTVAIAPLEASEQASGAIVFPWAAVEVVGESDQRSPAGSEGAVRIRSPQLVENLKATGSGSNPNIREGWFYPGDIGSLDENGALHLAGRSSDVINRGGVKVSGTRIEEILQSLPEIREAAVCGVAGPSGLEEIWIGIVANGPVDVGQIKSHLREHNDIRVAPDEVIILDELPRGDLGKVQKPRLRELLLELKGRC